MKKIFILLVLLISGLAFIFIALSPKKEIRAPFFPSKTPSKQSTQRPLDFKLILPQEFNISIFAENIENARDLELSPGGTLLVSSPSDGKVFALPDRNNDGIADEVKVILEGQSGPHGLAFYKEKLFVVDQNKVVLYKWDENLLMAKEEKVLFELPGGGGHDRYTISFNKKGNMFVSLGSTCNVCREKHPWRATVIITNENGDNPQFFAKGLRNAPFITVNPQTGELWGTEMGRDFLGDNKPPDEINIIRAEKNYGWPICYGNKIHDTNFDPTTASGQSCRNTEAPIFEIAAHSAPLGLTFIDSEQFPKSWQGDLLVAYHGSWNRSTPIGYKVVRMDVLGNKILAEEDFITGFLPKNALVGQQANGRPVDLIFDKKGNLYISDDKKGAIYIISKKQ